MHGASIPGYRLGDSVLPRSPLTGADLAALKASLLFGDEDAAVLRKAHDVVKDQVEAILDVWYGFVGNTPAKKGHSAAEVEAMHAAWTKSVLLQAILWCRPYTKDRDF